MTRLTALLLALVAMAAHGALAVALIESGASSRWWFPVQALAFLGTAAAMLNYHRLRDRP